MTSMTSLETGYQALVIGASGGIGSAVVEKLRQDPRCGGVLGLSRSHDGLDVTDEASLAAMAEKLGSEARVFDLIFCATGALTINDIGPEKSIRALDQQAMAAQFALNAIGPALVLKYFSPMLARKSRSVFGILSARVGSIGDNRLGGWISYRAAKAAVNQIIRTSAIELQRNRPSLVLAALHPGTVATTLSQAYSGNHERQPPEQAAASLLQVLNQLSPEQSGGFYAYDGQEIVW